MSTINVLGPVGFNPTGPYDATRAYQKLDVVYYQGSSYVAISDSLGQLPTNADYWLCIAAGSLKQFVYDSVASMKADNTLADGMTVQTLGYYDINDGGGAVYKIREITNDDVIDEQYIIEVYDNLLVAELIIRSPIDVRCLGIKGDGNATSSDLANGLKKHDSFIFKDGTYVIPQLTLENLTKYELYGVNATLSGTSSFIFNSCTNIKVNNLNFDSNTNNVFLFKDCQNVNVKNNKFTNSTTATIRMQRTHGNICKNLKFINNNFIGVSKTNAWGGALYIDGQGKLNPSDTTETLPIEQIEVRGNLFEEVGTGGVNFGGAKDVIVDSNIFKNSYGDQNMLSTYSRESTNIVITNNTFSGCGWECCILNYCNNATISGNYFEDYAYGITLENSTSNVIINANVFNGMRNERTHTGGSFQASTYGIVLNNINMVNINGNNISDCSTNIIFAAKCYNVNVIANKLLNSSNGISYDDSSGNSDNVNIIGNVVNTSYSAISIGGRGLTNISDNFIISTNKGLSLIQIYATSIVNIINNYIKSGIGIDESSIYNVACKQTIKNNNVEATTQFKKYAYDVGIGYIEWFNPKIILDETNICNAFVKGSIINYNYEDFSTNAPGTQLPVGYYMGNVANGAVFIMSNGQWRRKTGGGGSSPITTTNW